MSEARVALLRKNPAAWGCEVEEPNLFRLWIDCSLFRTLEVNPGTLAKEIVRRAVALGACASWEKNIFERTFSFIIDLRALPVVAGEDEQATVALRVVRATLLGEGDGA